MTLLYRYISVDLHVKLGIAGKWSRYLIDGDAIHESIKAGYATSSNTQGWRFLYSHRSVLHDANVAIIGLNPGGIEQIAEHGELCHAAPRHTSMSVGKATRKAKSRSNLKFNRSANGSMLSLIMC